MFRDTCTENIWTTSQFCGSVETVNRISVLNVLEPGDDRLVASQCLQVCSSGLLCQ